MRFINKKNCRRYALDMAEGRFNRRKFTEVASSFYFHLDAMVKTAIDDLVEELPNKGKTVKPRGY